MHPETFGTNAYFLAVQRRWVTAGRLSIRSGLAVEYLEASFTRPFDHSVCGRAFSGAHCLLFKALQQALPIAYCPLPPPPPTVSTGGTITSNSRTGVPSLQVPIKRCSGVSPKAKWQFSPWRRQSAKASSSFHWA
jgi:hypothetical protein